MGDKLRTYLNRQFFRRHWPIVGLAFCIIGGHFTAFLLGIHPVFMSLFLLGALLKLSGFVFIIICLITTVIRVFRRQSFATYSLSWALIAALNFIPGIIPSAAGAMITLIFAGPQQVVEEGRNLITNYETPKNINCDYTFPVCGQTTEYPPAIQRLNPVYITVTSEYVLIKKFGLGDVAGFMIFPSGTNPDGIKLIDGLYWIDSW